MPLSLELTAVETRILGCLLEKERTTPENYPLSLHGLTAACNQTTGRDPVLSLDEKTVENGVNSLREKKLATMVFGSGSRVQKYRHNLPDHFELDRRDFAILCVLLLRGPQTPGELRARTERLCAFGSLEEVEACLAELGRGDSPLVRALPARPGQKELRFAQLLSGGPDTDTSPLTVKNVTCDAPPPPDRVDILEKEIAALRNELAVLREEFAEFRRQFE